MAKRLSVFLLVALCAASWPAPHARAQSTSPPPPASAPSSAPSASGPSSAQTPSAAPATTPAPGAAASAASASESPAAPTTPELQTADEEYNLKMRELEDMVSELKEQIFRSKGKLQLLAEQVAGGVGTGAKIVIVHKNQMGGNFLLTEANYYLDGQPLWQEVDETGLKLTEKRDLPIWDGNIVEGSHTLNVNLVYKGNGTGVWQYLSAYTWKPKASITFTAEPGKVVTIDAIGYEKGNFTTAVEDRPNIRFDLKVSRDAVPVKKGEGTTP